MSIEPSRSLKKPELKTVPSRTIVRPAKASTKHNPLLSEACLAHLNYRIQQEEYSSRIYLSMSMWLNDNAFKNTAAVWKKYSEEELSHANWAREYLLSMGVQPSTPALAAPGDNYAGLPEIVQISFDHEITITEQCKELAKNAFRDGDTMLFTLTQKYLSEQIEEHDKMQNHMDALETFGTDKIALRLFDNSLES